MLSLSPPLHLHARISTLPHWVPSFSQLVLPTPRNARQEEGEIEVLTFTALKVAILMPKLPLEQFPECINMGARLYSYRQGSHYAGGPHHGTAAQHLSQPLQDLAVTVSMGSSLRLLPGKPRRSSWSKGTNLMIVIEQSRAHFLEHRLAKSSHCDAEERQPRAKANQFLSFDYSTGVFSFILSSFKSTKPQLTWNYFYLTSTLVFFWYFVGNSCKTIWLCLWVFSCTRASDSSK